MGKKKMPDPEPDTLGHVYGRPDTERVGLFADMGYLIGKRQTPQLMHNDIRDKKKRQMYPGGPKIKTGLNDCYFEQEFKRLFIGEGIVWKKRKGKKEQKGKGVSFPFYPPHVSIRLRHLAQAFGTFDGILPEFSPKLRPKKPYQKPSRGIFTSPGKKGGPGYVDIAINPYPEHSPDKYTPQWDNKKGVKGLKFLGGGPGDYFNPNPYQEEGTVKTYRKEIEPTWQLHSAFMPPSPAKLDGGCKAGTLNKWPIHEPDKYLDPPQVLKALAAGRPKPGAKPEAPKPARGPKGPAVVPFMPPASNRTLPSPSVMQSKAVVATNAVTWVEAKPVTFTRRFLVV